ncbi:MAG: hypothetical protein JSS20_04505 [Proteobacteria bacterium]|nr:hypothetical protein [Pseudomonadota bacterium]
MTRSTLARTLRWSYVLLVLVLAISLVSRLAEHIPGLAGTPLEKLAKDLYDYMKDMALVFVTVVATYLAGVFQKRQTFLASLKEEWREIVAAKSALFSYTQLESPSRAEYLMAFTAISETLDNMRTVYSNVGETDELIGLYPFAPLHDMRRALQSLDPAKNAAATPEDRKLARDAILQSFYALRETFLDELDLETPDRALLAFGMRRRKRSGSTTAARALQDRERSETDSLAPPDPALDQFLRRLYDKEHATAKPWRHVPGAKGAAPNEPEAPMS